MLGLIYGVRAAVTVGDVEDVLAQVDLLFADTVHLDAPNPEALETRIHCSGTLPIN
jgi:hypothetical protein